MAAGLEDFCLKWNDHHQVREKANIKMTINQFFLRFTFNIDFSGLFFKI
jgi:hypothetical protein